MQEATVTIEEPLYECCTCMSARALMNTLSEGQERGSEQRGTGMPYESSLSRKKPQYLSYCLGLVMLELNATKVMMVIFGCGNDDEDEDDHHHHHHPEKEVEVLLLCVVVRSMMKHKAPTTTTYYYNTTTAPPEPTTHHPPLTTQQHHYQPPPPTTTRTRSAAS
mmetsp:Transcript_18997/g.28718  ORF Transcript_18997/g.28718 Transcript_18997/m.28718 type:complete len:164 (-) Transcript_18997:73-564(-)